MPDFSALGIGAAEAAVNRATSTGIVLAASPTAHVKGAWTQLIAATAYQTAWLLAIASSTSNAGQSLTDIGIGPAGGEVVVVADLFYDHIDNSLIRPTSWLLPVTIPRGARLAARSQPVVGTAVALLAIMLLAPTIASPTGLGLVQTGGANPEATRGTPIDPGAVANTPGAWIELMAASAHPYRWLCLDLGFGGATTSSGLRWLFDIAVGPPGSEQIVLPGLMAGYNVPIPGSHCLPCAIPAGSRVSVRAACTSALATGRIIDAVLHGVG